MDFKKIKSAKCPIILVINKIDRLKDKAELLPLIKEYSEKANFTKILPLYAKSANDVALLEKTIAELLPKGIQQFPQEQITDRSQRFLAAEIVREKVMRQTGNEIPYSVAIEVEEYTEKQNIIHIGILIIVDKRSQKTIIIGNKGERLKEIGRQARLDLENMLQTKVFLRLWVKIREGWADDERALRSLGYRE